KLDHDAVAAHAFPGKADVAILPVAWILAHRITPARDPRGKTLKRRDAQARHTRIDVAQLPANLRGIEPAIVVELPAEVVHLVFEQLDEAGRIGRRLRGRD